MTLYFKPKASWFNESIGSRWTNIREFRSIVTTAIEEKRKDGLLGSSLQAKVIIYTNQNVYDELIDINLSDLFICSDVEININNEIKVNSIDVTIELASGGKCLRCWKVVKEVKDDIEICNRCKSVLKR